MLIILGSFFKAARIKQTILNIQIWIFAFKYANVMQTNSIILESDLRHLQIAGGVSSHRGRCDIVAVPDCATGALCVQLGPLCGAV